MYRNSTCLTGLLDLYAEKVFLLFLERLCSTLFVSVDRSPKRRVQDRVGGCEGRGSGLEEVLVEEQVSWLKEGSTTINWCQDWVSAIKCRRNPLNLLLRLPPMIEFRSHLLKRSFFGRSIPIGGKENEEEEPQTRKVGEDEDEDNVIKHLQAHIYLLARIHVSFRNRIKPW